MTTLTLRPTGDGHHTVLKPFPASPSTLYDKVNEVVPDGDASFIYDNGSAFFPKGSFTFGFSAIPPAAVIAQVQLILNVRKTGIGAATFKHLLRTGGIDNLGLAISPTQSYASVPRTMATNPFTGLPWTRAEVLNTEFGIEGDAAVGADVRCTQAYVTVTYTNPPQGKYFFRGVP